jgi:hypothetical protein
MMPPLNALQRCSYLRSAECASVLWPKSFGARKSRVGRRWLPVPVTWKAQLPSRSIPTSTARSVWFPPRSQSGARRRCASLGSPRTLRSGRLARSRRASERGAARRGGPDRVRRGARVVGVEFIGGHGRRQAMSLVAEGIRAIGGSRADTRRSRRICRGIRRHRRRRGSTSIDWLDIERVIW